MRFSTSSPFSIAAFLSLLFLLHLQGCSGSSGSSSARNDEKNTARRIDCFKELNAARSLVDFPAFTDGSLSKDTKFPLDNENLIATQCSLVAGLLGMELIDIPTQRVHLKHSEYAFFVQEEDDEPDCAAAVKYWKDAFSNFKGLPGPFSSTEMLYRSLQNVSFLVLFNGQPNPSIDCAFFTCPLKEFQLSGGAGTSKKTVDKKLGYGLSCLTAPDAYSTGQPPYTEEQWEKITAGLTNSHREITNGLSFTSFPSFFTFVATALAVAFL